MKFLKKNIVFVSSVVILIVVSVSVFTFRILHSEALPSTFDPNTILTDDDFYGLQPNFRSPQQIQTFLVNNRSMLANITVNVSLEADDIFYNTNFSSQPDHLQPRKVLAPFFNTNMRPADIIWGLSQTDMGNGCSTSYPLCINNRTRGVNPVFIMGMIQRESGLVWGVNAQKDPNSAEARFLLDRVLGYTCNESGIRSTSCFDENPDWKYYKGFFRQLYYGMRNFRIFADVCANSSIPYRPSHSPFYRVGQTVNFESPVRFNNGITCALYRYTPHIYNGQFNLYNSMRSMYAADTDLIFIARSRTRFKSILPGAANIRTLNIQNNSDSLDSKDSESAPDPTKNLHPTTEQVKDI